MKLVLTWLVIAQLNLFNTVPDLLVYRKLMEQSVENSDTAEQFYEQSKYFKEDGAPIWLGFRAMSEIILCKHAYNPISKLSHFKKGRKLLDYAISKSKDNPELLFFRFTTQSNIPSLLNYSANLEEDKLALISYLKKEATEDKDLHCRIKTFLLSAKYCSQAEIQLIKTL